MNDRNASRLSLAGFVVAVVAVSVGTVAGLEFVPVVGTYVGMLLGGFVAGLAVEERPLLESGLAAVLADLGVLVVGATIGSGIVAALTALGSIGATTVLVSIALSFAVGAFGAHFGSDLRAGIAEPVEEPRSGSTTFGVPPSSTDQSSEGEPSSARDVEDDRETSTVEDEREAHVVEDEPRRAEEESAADVRRPDWVAEDPPGQEGETAEDVELEREE